MCACVSGAERRIARAFTSVRAAVALRADTFGNGSSRSGI